MKKPLRLLEFQIEKEIVGGHRAVATTRPGALPGGKGFGVSILRKQRGERLRQHAAACGGDIREVEFAVKGAVDPVARQIDAGGAVAEVAADQMQTVHGNPLTVDRFEGEVGDGGVALHVAHRSAMHIHIHAPRQGSTGKFVAKAETRGHEPHHIGGHIHRGSVGVDRELPLGYEGRVGVVHTQFHPCPIVVER